MVEMLRISLGPRQKKSGPWSKCFAFLSGTLNFVFGAVLDKSREPLNFVFGAMVARLCLALGPLNFVFGAMVEELRSSLKPLNFVFGAIV